MNTEFKKFIFKLTIVALFVLLIGWIIFSFFLQKYYLPVFPLVLAFFYLFTLFIHAYQLRLAKKDFAKFTRSNMIMTFLKLMVYSAFTVIYLANSKDNAVPFVIVVMILYVIFTMLEVSDLMRIVKTGSGRK